MQPGSVNSISEVITHIAEFGAGFLELLGVGVIVVFAIYTTINALTEWLRGKKDKTDIYEKYRLLFARGILIGLELLVAADIIHTVAVNLTFTSVGVLAVIVLIRTFLSFTLEMEATGKWPWDQ